MRWGGAARVGPPRLPSRPPSVGLSEPVMAIPTAARMLYYSMKHRTQLYLDEGQYRWLEQRAGKSGSIAAVVRELIDAERSRRPIRPRTRCSASSSTSRPARGGRETSVTTLDRDLYGA